MDREASSVERLDPLDDTEGDAGTDEIEATRAEIEQTRCEMAETIDAIREKLSPEHLLHEARETIREATIGRAQEAAGHAVETAKEAVTDVVESAREAMSNAGDTARGTGAMMMETIRQNPLPAALTGLGLAWLWMSARRQSAGPDRYPWAYRPTEDLRPGSSAAGSWDQAGSRDGGVIDPMQERAADVARQVQAQASQVVERVQTQAAAVTDRVQDRVSEWGSQAQYQAQKAGYRFQEMLEENPLTVAAIAMAIGAGVGLAAPVSRQESQIMGAAREQLVDRAQQAVQGVAQKAQTVAQEALGAAKEEARNQGLTA